MMIRSGLWISALLLAGSLSAEGVSQGTPIKLWPEGVEYHGIEPLLEIFLPAPEKAIGTAVVICPGGGYARLALDHEGREIARKFNENGIAAFVLHYRHKEDPYPAPLLDVQRAIRMVRFEAKEFGIDPNSVGVMGFSAGGHLASMAGTLFKGPGKNTSDEIDRQNDRPDFMILIYPVISLSDSFAHRGSARNLLGKNPGPLAKELSSQNNVTTHTPPTFLVHASDDRAVPVQNSIVFYQALLKNKIPAEMHLYENGGHGFGMNKRNSTVQYWIDDCIRWIKRAD